MGGDAGSGALTLGPFFFRVIASAGPVPVCHRKVAREFELTALRTRVSRFSNSPNHSRNAPPMAWFFRPSATGVSSLGSRSRALAGFFSAARRIGTR
jgi:hypothetical protein